MSRKGLFHIVEIVIITLIMFIMLSQLSSVPEYDTEWDQSKITAQGRDVLYSLSESGVDWSDEGAVTRILEYAFNETQIQYRLEYEGAPQANIGVGCLNDGTPAHVNFCDWLETFLASKGTLTFNNFSVRFSVINTSTINNLFDVIVTDQELTGLDSDVANYLAAGRGFVLVRDLAQPDFTDYGGTLRDYFALEYDSSPGAGFVGFELFDLTFQPEYYMIPSYFKTIPNSSGERYNLSHQFFAFSNDNVRKLQGADGRVILETSSGDPACIAKSSASDNRGRSAWISESAGEEDWSVMLTSLIIWSSEHRRYVTGEELGNRQASATVYHLPWDTSRPDYMFQPMEAVLTMGYLF